MSPAWVSYHSQCKLIRDSYESHMISYAISSWEIFVREGIDHFDSKMKYPHNPKNLYCPFSTTSRACHWWKAVSNRRGDRESNHTRNKTQNKNKKQKTIHFLFFVCFVSMPITMAIHSTGDGGAILTWTLSTWMSVSRVMLWPALDGEPGTYVKPTQPRQIRSNQIE
jgi:hypothetical protein